MSLQPIETGVVGLGVQQIGAGFARARPTVAAPPAAVFLLDFYPNASIAYSLRKLRTGYGGSAVRIRRSSDNAEANIGFDAEGDFDTAAAASHIGGGSGFVVTWFDQSGGGRDVTQATAGQQPLYVASSTINGFPAVDFDGTDDELKNASVNASDIITTQGTIFAVVLNDTGVSGNSGLFAFNQGTESAGCTLWANYSDGNLYWFLGSDSSFYGTGETWEDMPHVLECFRDSSDIQAMVIDGITRFSATRTTDASGTGVVMALGETRAGQNFDGRVAEFVLWPTDIGP